MSVDVFKVMRVGPGATIQDGGRSGWRRFGVPRGGAMDERAACAANRLLDNAVDAPLLELLPQGTELAVLRDVWIAITGANVESTHSLWRAVRVRQGETIRLGRASGGVWSYVAVEGGVDAARVLGSASVYARGGLGRNIAANDVVRRSEGNTFHLPAHVAGRIAPWTEQREHRAPPPLRVWAGPQWDSFSAAERERFFARNWTVTSQSDRAGYRLAGEPLRVPPTQIISEAVRVGSIQIPEGGQPIVTLRDGPTVGGYAKLGLVHADDLSWLVQCCAGQVIRFQFAG